MTFRQFIIILWARRKIALAALLLTVLPTVLVSKSMPKTYTATTTLVINYKATDPVSGQALPAQFLPGYLATQIDVIRSRNVALKVVDDLGLATQPAWIRAFSLRPRGTSDIRAWLADTLSEKLQVKLSQESNTIEVACDDQNPGFAATLANAFAEAYIQTNLRLNVEPSRRTAAWFSDQVQNLRDNVVTAQRALADYQRENGIVSLDERIDVESARLAELSNQLVLAQAQTFDSSAKQRQMYSGKRLDQLSSEVSSARQREAALRAALEQQKALVMQINQQRDELGILQGDVATAQKVLDATMQRFSQTHMEGQANQSEAAVLDPAVPPMKPGKPNMMVNALVSIFLGTLLAVGISMLAEMHDRRVHVPEDLTLGLNLPVLGIVAVPRLRN